MRLHHAFWTACLGILLPQAAPTQGYSQRLLASQDLLIAPEAANLSLAIGLTISRAGVIVVTQPQDNALRFFSATGVGLGSFGREGGGPGEFRSLGSPGWIGDTMWVPDPALRRITLVSPGRQLIGTIPVPGSATYQDAGEGSPKVSFSFEGSPAGVYAGGDLLFLAVTWSPKGGGWPHTPVGPMAVPYVLVEANGKVERIIGWHLPNADCTMVIGPVQSGVPFCTEVIEAASADGHLLAIASLARANAKEGAVRITVLSDMGDTVFSRLYPFVPQPIPSAVIDSARNRRARYGMSADSRAAAGRMNIPRFYPPFGGVLVGRDGTVWIEMRSTHTDHLWLALEKDGSVLGLLHLPEAVELKVAQRNRIWGFIENESGEQGIVRYAVTRVR